MVVNTMLPGDNTKGVGSKYDEAGQSYHVRIFDSIPFALACKPIQSRYFPNYS